MGASLWECWGHSQMGGHFIEADTTVTFHVLPAVDLEVPVGVDRDQDGANVGLGDWEKRVMHSS